MKNITQHTGTLNIIKRLDNSHNGNPRYLLSIDGVRCRTMTDSMHGYKITNYDGKQVIATIGTHYKNPTLDTIRSV